MRSGIFASEMKKNKYKIYACLFLIAVSINSGYTYSNDALSIDRLISLHRHKIGHAKQIVLVLKNSHPRFGASTFLFEKIKGQWKRCDNFDSTIGKTGFAAPGKKIEGDFKTPSGIYTLGTAFGYTMFSDTKMKFRVVSENDFWVDDINSSQYNTWVRGRPKSGSFELMRRKDNLYKLGIVVNYNIDPVIKGKGSAVFVHIWRNNNSPTAGCVAMSESNMRKLLRWLDPEKTPLIVMGKKHDIFQNF